MQQNSTLIVDLTTNDDGALTIQLPRNITDSKSPQNEDEDYIVFVDSIQSDTEEVTSNNLKQGLFLSSVVQSKVSDVPGQVDIIDVFRRSEDVPPVVDDAIKKKGIKVIWMQSGIYNKDAERKVKENGIDVVYNRCMKVEQCALIKQKLSLMHRSNTIDIDTMYRSSICFQD
jgi:predicted CoA-binding protein